MNHPSICKMLGVMAAENQHTLVCEYVAGTNLFDYLHKYHKTIPIGKQIAISVQICDAMAYVHECNLIHRDLKPQNVIYQERTGIAKLCDFGLARVLPNNLTELHPAQVLSQSRECWPNMNTSSHIGRHPFINEACRYHMP